MMLLFGNPWKHTEGCTHTPQTQNAPVSSVTHHCHASKWRRCAALTVGHGLRIFPDLSFLLFPHNLYHKTHPTPWLLLLSQRNWLWGLRPTFANYCQTFPHTHPTTISNLNQLLLIFLFIFISILSYSKPNLKLVVICGSSCLLTSLSQIKLSNQSTLPCRAFHSLLLFSIHIISTLTQALSFIYF